MPINTRPLDLVVDIPDALEKLMEADPQHELLRFAPPYFDTKNKLDAELQLEFYERFQEGKSDDGSDILGEYLAVIEDALEEVKLDEGPLILTTTDAVGA